MARVRQARSSRVDRLHRTLDVPQADRLGNVRQLVAAIRDGIDHAATLLELLDVDHRHFLYYRQAAVILGVVEFNARGELCVTSFGQRLLASAEGSPDERLVFADAIAQARALRPFASFFAGEPLDLPTLTRRLEVLTGLSHSTAERRAHTLIKWRRYVQGPTSENNGGLELADPAPQIETLVARHNALVKQQTLQWLMGVAPGDFEKIVADLLRAMGYLDVTQRGGPFDGGVDVVAGASTPGATAASSPSRPSATPPRSAAATSTSSSAPSAASATPRPSSSPPPNSRPPPSRPPRASRTSNSSTAPGSSTCSPPTACSCRSASLASSSGRSSVGRPC